MNAPIIPQPKPHRKENRMSLNADEQNFQDKNPVHREHP